MARRCCLTSGSKIRENGCLRAIVTIMMVTSHWHVNPAMGGGGSNQRRSSRDTTLIRHWLRRDRQVQRLGIVCWHGRHFGSGIDSERNLLPSTAVGLEAQDEISPD